MKTMQIMLFAGTTEGRRLCAYFVEKGQMADVYVTTEYGKELLPKADNLSIHVGKLDRQQMLCELDRIQPELVLDATHPYAAQVTQNLEDACKQTGVSYMRVLREQSYLRSNIEEIVFMTDGIVETVALLNSQRFQRSRILLTTGSKNLQEYQKISNYQERVYLRVLPNPEVFAASIAAGFASAHLIGMQGPFSEELNYALFKQLGIDVLVTKESGRSGGFEEKLRAAERAAIPVVVIKRPKEEEGKTVAEVIAYLDMYKGQRSRE